MSVYKLGDFEYWVLTAVLELGEEAYGALVQEKIQEVVHRLRNVSLGAVHTTLYRLKEKGLLSDRLGEPTPERGGRAKRFFKVTAQGRLALADKNKAYAVAKQLHSAYGV